MSIIDDAIEAGFTAYEAAGGRLGANTHVSDAIRAALAVAMPNPCHRTGDHLGHMVPMMIRCEGRGEQVCSGRDHVGPWVTVPFTEPRQSRCEACGAHIPALDAAKPNRCTEIPGRHDPHTWDGAVTGKVYRCDGDNAPVLNRGANQ